MSNKKHFIDVTENGKVVNLRQKFGQRYRIQFDPAYEAEHGKRGRSDDPWLQVIPCHRGEIYPLVDEYLVASTRASGSIANRLRSLSCCSILRDGDDGVDVKFHNDDYRKVFNLMSPRGAQTLSEERRENLIEAGRNSRFQTPPPPSQDDSDPGGQPIPKPEPSTNPGGGGLPSAHAAL